MPLRVPKIWIALACLSVLSLRSPPCASASSGPALATGGRLSERSSFRWPEFLEPTVAAADSQRLAERLDRIRHSSTVTIFQVDGWYPDCRLWTSPLERFIDCRPIIQEVPAPSKAWRGSLVGLLTSPGALVPLRTKVCVCSDDVVVRFASDIETTIVWFCTGCAAVGVPTPTSVMGFDFDLGRETLRSLLYSPLPRVEYESRSEFAYYDTPPQLVWSPEVPRELRVDGAAHADTILFHIRIRKDGRVSQLRLKRGVLGLDSLAANLVGRYVYRPAISADHPVSVWFEVAVPVPKRAR